jgi:hypothetical protein
MSKAYRISKDGSTSVLKRLRVRNEEQDLQVLLEQNPDLLVGEQIRPEDPCRWLLVDREIAVQDPETGSDRWSLDLFLVDQSAIPTFVECKRFADTRSRREVVAQMLDYAANANYYWNKDDLRAAAERTAQRQGTDLETRLGSLKPDGDQSVESFFQRVEDNLREGQVRMVFFLEEAPWQLRSIVDFLNRQMERSEVLIVEARQYQDRESRVVVPHLFGYTEEARRVKRTVSVDKRAQRHWNRDTFLQALGETVGFEALEPFRTFIDAMESLGAEMAWGRGTHTGSLNAKWPGIVSKSMASIYTDGKISLNLGWLNGEEDVPARDRFLTEIRDRTTLAIPDSCLDKYLYFSWEDWRDSLSGLLAAIRATVEAGRAIT